VGSEERGKAGGGTGGEGGLGPNVKHVGSEKGGHGGNVAKEKVVGGAAKEVESSGEEEEEEEEEEEDSDEAPSDQGEVRQVTDTQNSLGLRVEGSEFRV